MPKKLTRKDYETILNYYKIPFSRNDKLISVRKQAEDILSSKLCRCIKRITKKKHPDGEKRAIPICKKTILHKKKLTDSGFTCKKSKSIKLRRLTGGRTRKQSRHTRI